MNEKFFKVFLISLVGLLAFTTAFSLFFSEGFIGNFISGKFIIEGFDFNELGFLENNFDNVHAMHIYYYDYTSSNAQKLADSGVNTILLSTSGLYPGLSPTNNKECTIPEIISSNSENSFSAISRNNNLSIFYTIAFSCRMYNGDTRFENTVLKDGTEINHTSPWDENFWANLTYIVKGLANLSLNDSYPISGVWIDFELYVLGGGKYFNDSWGFEDSVFERYFLNRSLEEPIIQRSERYSWLEDNDKLEDYYLFLHQEIKRLARNFRDEVKDVNPNFLIGAYPSPYPSMLYLNDIFSAWGSVDDPMIVWGIETYGYYTGGTSRLPEGLEDNRIGNYYNLTEYYYNISEYYGDEIYAYYLSGFLTNRYKTQDIFGNYSDATNRTNGYWVFTSYSLLRNCTSLANSGYRLPVNCYSDVRNPGCCINAMSFPDENWTNECCPLYDEGIEQYFQELSKANFGYCGDGSCHFNEDKKSCAIDCGSEFPDNYFNHYLNFYQIRYGDIEADSSPYPDLVEFTIGQEYEGKARYAYVLPSIIYGHYRANRIDANNISLNLTEEELDNLFNGETYVTYDIIQRADIEKIQERMFPGVTLDLGVETFANGSIKLNSLNNASIPTNSLSDYQDGKTILLPAHNKSGLTCLFNLNSFAVREYIVLNILKKSNVSETSLMFLDGPGISMTDLREGGMLGSTLHYISPDNESVQAQIYSNLYLEILNEVKNRNSEAQFIHNALIDSSKAYYVYENDWAQIISENNALNGFMVENRFWLDDWANNVDYYLNWTRELKQKDAKILYAFGEYDLLGDIEQESNGFIWRMWLWLHLVADDNTYVYMNPDYSDASVNYSVYGYPLGLPLDEPYKENETWYREYERGTIIFNTSSGEINDIEFVERDYLESEVIIGNRGSTSSGLISLSEENKTNESLVIEDKDIEKLIFLETEIPFSEQENSNDFNIFLWIFLSLFGFVAFLLVLFIILKNKKVKSVDEFENSQESS